MKKLLTIITLFVIGFGVLNYGERLMYPTKYGDMVYKYSQEFGVEPELVFAIIKAESGFDKNAVSRSRAIGLMQLMEDTAGGSVKRLGIKEFNEEMLFNPDTNIRIGCWHLSKLVKEFGSVYAVVAAYNAGGKNVRNWLGDVDYKKLSYEDVSKNIRYGETRIYLERVLKNYKMYKKIYSSKVEVKL